MLGNDCPLDSIVVRLLKKMRFIIDNRNVAESSRAPQQQHTKVASTWGSKKDQNRITLYA